MAISAPLKPGVNAASLLAYYYFVYFGESFNGFKWTKKISNLPLRSGNPTSTYLSNLPDLTSAASRIYFLFVAAITITLEFVPNPSISTNNWFNVLSLSSFDPNLFILFFPTASNSSMKIIAGALALAWAKSSRTLDAPTPTKTSTKSDPDTE